MSRTGRKSIKAKPSGLRQQVKQDRKVRKLHASREKDREYKAALDRTTTEDNMALRGSSAKQQAQHGLSTKTEQMLAVFEQLRGK
ncbi:hypothetical protein PYCC9005_000012 [Savitreella phatthalungensis]